MNLKTKEQQNLKLIEKINSCLEQVIITDFAASIGKSRQALYYLLNPKNAAITKTKSLLALEEQVTRYLADQHKDIETRNQLTN